VEGVDTNGDGLYSEEELKPLAQTNIEALKDFEYFTFPFIGDIDSMRLGKRTGIFCLERPRSRPVEDRERAKEHQRGNCA
ncbi:MAG: DUF1007 family protein, partial [Rhodomicrobium sp.]